MSADTAVVRDDNLDYETLLEQEKELINGIAQFSAIRLALSSLTTTAVSEYMYYYLLKQEGKSNSLRLYSPMIALTDYAPHLQGPIKNVFNDLYEYYYSQSIAQVTTQPRDLMREQEGECMRPFHVLQQQGSPVPPYLAVNNAESPRNTAIEKERKLIQLAEVALNEQLRW